MDHLRKTHRARIAPLFALPALVMAMLGWRLHVVQVENHEHYAHKADGQHHATIPIRPKRGRILSSNGEELAVSTPAYAVYAETRLIERDHEELARRLATALGKHGEQATIERRLRSGKVVALARRIDAGRKERVEMLNREFKLPRYALRFEEEGRRHYPNGSLAAHILGYVGLDDYGDNKGLEGLELLYDERLRGSNEKFEVARDAVQKRMEPIAEEAYRSAFGDTMTLTIDSSIQHAAEQILADRCQTLEAEGGSALVVEVETGRILAMASYPTFDLNNFARSSPESRRNRCVSFAYEPGSVQKILTLAIAIDEGVVTPETIIDCEGGRARIHGRNVRDSGTHFHEVPVRDIFRMSSNIGSIKSALKMDEELFYRRLKDFGVGELTGVDVTGESPGFITSPSDWSGFSKTSFPMGYEMRQTPVQLGQAIAAIANGGVMTQLHIVDSFTTPEGVVEKVETKRLRRVVKPKTSRQMLDLMELVVNEGTGKSARIPGYRVGGKTGTTRKYKPELPGGYAAGYYYASFCGVFPIGDPKILIHVMIDEAKSDAYGGGSVAGPVFRDVALEVARVLAIAPDKPWELEEKRGTHARREREPEQTRVPELRLVGPDDLALLDDGGALEDAGPLDAPWEATVGDRVDATQPERWPMPDLRGQTMAEVRETLSKLAPSLKVEFNGTGVVVAQTPEAGGMADAAEVATLIFAPELPPPPAPEKGKKGR